MFGRVCYVLTPIAFSEVLAIVRNAGITCNSGLAMCTNALLFRVS